MSTITKKGLLAWAPIAIGLAAMYLPSLIDLYIKVWSSTDQLHGPIVLGMSIWLIYRKWPEMLKVRKQKTGNILAWVIILIGAAVYATGRSQSIQLLELLSTVISLSGIILLNYGTSSLRVQWFSLFFIIFAVPLPASIVDIVTLPLKIVVSNIAEHVLYFMNYPIARSGVILQMGQYQLLVADACAGLNSLFTLEALGLLYMNLVRHTSLFRNVTLALLIVPISIASNSIRIIVLALITYYWGESAGQGYLHSISGVVLFMCALVFIITIDGMLNILIVKMERAGINVHHNKTEAGLKNRKYEESLLSNNSAKNNAFAMVFMIFAVIIASELKLPDTSQDAPSRIKFRDNFPKNFGDWEEIPSLYEQVEMSVEGNKYKTFKQPYDDVLTKTYKSRDGKTIMLALAYAREQQQDVKIHLPEVCYSAQGFEVRKLQNYDLAVLPEGGKLPGRRMIAKSGQRDETVTYWIRMGDEYIYNSIEMRLKIFYNKLNRKNTDGMLVRASMIISKESEADTAYKLEEQFMKQIVETYGGDLVVK